MLAAKEYSSAAIEFRSAAQAAPNDAEPFYQLGLAYLGSGDARAAFAAFKRATELNPKHAGAQLKLAELMVTSQNKGVLELARKQLQDLLLLTPDDPKALDAMALAEFKLGKQEDGTELLDKALAKTPTDLQASILLTRFKLNEHDAAGAEQVLQKAVASAPKSADASLALGVLYQQLEKTDLAEAQFRHALELDSQYAPAILSLARLQARGKNPDLAEQTFKQLSSIQNKEYKDYRPLYARFLFARGKRDAALAEFQRLAKEDPSDRAARTRLVTAYVLMNRTQEAAKILSDALKHNPNDSDALLQQSDLYLRAGDAAAAEKDLNLALKFKPDSAAAHFGLAKVRHMTGNLPFVETQELNQALSYNPSYLAARIALCQQFLQANQFKAVLDLLEKTPPAQQSSELVLVARNWALIGLGKNDEAQQGVEQGLRLGRAPDLLMQDGILKLKGQDFSGARAVAEEILAQDPEDPRAVGMLVDSYAGQKEFGKAVERVTEMVAKHPKSGKLLMMQGRLLADTGNAAAERKAYEAAEAVAPNLAAVKLALARMDFSENRPDAARQRVNALLALEPRNVDGLTLAGDIELKSGNRAGAIAKYRAVLEIDALNIRGLNRLAYVSPDDALKFADKAQEMAPNSGEVQDAIGWMYYRKGAYSTATEHLKAAVAREPTARHQFHLAMSCIKGGDQALGQEMLTAALNKDPALPKKEEGW